MKLVATEEERDLAAAMRDLFTTHCPTTLVRALREPGGERFPQKLWEALVRAEVLALPFAADVGGSDGTLDDLAVVYAEAGRALCPSVVLNTIHLGLAIDALAAPDRRAARLPSLIRGDLRGTVAVASPYDATDVRPRLRAERTADGLRVTGRLDYVGDADLADAVLTTAAVETYGEPDEVLALLVDPAAPGVQLTPLPTSADDRWHEIVLDGVLVADDAVLGAVGEEELRRVALTVRALQCVDMAAGAETVIARTVAHTCSREQFGRPIGSFQAAQHLVADMHIATQAARLAARSAVFWLGRGRPGVRETAIAVLKAATAYRRVTADAHQLHGGMGYVLETDLHLWSERARRLGVEGGGVDVAAGWLA